MLDRKPADQMDVGDEFEPLEFTITPELNQQYLFAVEDYHPRYLGGGDGGQSLVHPALLLNFSNTTRSPSYVVSPGLGTLHAGEETRFVRPATVGDTLRVTWRVVDRYEKRGRVYHVREAVVVDGTGRTVLVRRLTSTYSSKQSG